MTDPDAIRDAIDALRATGQDSTADMLEALSAKLADVEAERAKDHAEINTKAAFIERTINQLAGKDQTIAELKAEIERLRTPQGAADVLLSALPPDFGHDGLRWKAGAAAERTLRFTNYQTDRIAAVYYAVRSALVALKGDRHEP